MFKTFLVIDSFFVIAWDDDTIKGSTAPGEVIQLNDWYSEKFINKIIINVWVYQRNYVIVLRPANRGRESKAQGHLLVVINSSCCQYYAHMNGLSENLSPLIRAAEPNTMLCDHRNKCQSNDKQALNIYI